MARGVLGWSARLLLVLVVGGCNCGAPDPEVGPPSSESSSGVAPRGGTEEPHEPVPASPQLRWPHNGAETGSPHAPQPDEVHSSSLRPRFLWNPVESASRYEIEVDDDCVTADRESCAFDSAELRESVETTTFRPGAPLPVSMEAPVGRRYFWRVRACNEGGCSAWSSVRYFDVGRAASDFNGDGYADLVLARLGGGPFPDENVSGYEVAFGSEDGTPQRPLRQLRRHDGCRVDRLSRLQHASDIDGDGFDDLGVRVRPERRSSDDDDTDFAFLFGGADGLDRCRLVTWLGGYSFYLVDNLAGEGATSVLACVSPISFWAWGPDDGFSRDSSLSASQACFSANVSLDADSDGTSDLLSSNNEGIHVFLGSGEGFGDATPGPSFSWSIGEACTGDFDGDGYADLLVPTNREVHLLPTSPGIAPRQESMIAWGPITTSESFASVYFPSEVRPASPSLINVACGDFDGDGRTDLVRRIDQGHGRDAVVSVQWFRWNDARETVETDITGTVGDGLPQASLDVDGDGRDELLLFVDHQRSSEIIVLHDVAAEARTRLRYDRGVRLIQTSQR